MRVLIISIIAVLASNSVSSTSTWPSVHPVTRSYTFVAKDFPSDFPVQLLIRTIQGVPAYRLECIRHFRMRGMSVTLEFTDLKWRDRQGPQGPRLQQFTFLVTITPDPTANSATSDRPKASRPPGSCDW